MMSRVNPCIFCKIINKSVPGFILYETDDVIVFMSRENHPLVVPKTHIQNIYDLDENTGHHIMNELRRTARAVKNGLECDGVYLTQANEPAAGQDVFHIHFHVYPRWEGIAMNQTEIVPDQERQEAAEKIKLALQDR